MLEYLIFHIVLAVYFLHFRGHSRMQPIWGSFFITCALIASVLTFTRFVWVSLFVVLFLQGWSSARFFSLTAFYRSSVMAFVTIIVVAYILGFLDGGSVGSAAAERSADTGSLEEKLIQIKLMWAAFTEHPIFGTGIGSHLELHASTSEISYSYEAQWFSLLMQLGLISIQALV